MKVGVPRETKTREYRVGMTPAGVRELSRRGHDVLVERGAGEGSGIRDEHYVDAGARIVPTAADAWSADLVVKVKEPQRAEYQFLRQGLTLYTYLHLAAEPDLTRELVTKGVTGLAYETIQPVLAQILLVSIAGSLASLAIAAIVAFRVQAR